MINPSRIAICLLGSFTMLHSLSVIGTAILATALIPTAAVASSCSNSPKADTVNGSYIGEYWPKLRQDIFRGIPYAQPPIGHLRFAVPQSLNTSWTGSHDAKAFSPSCVGVGSNAVGGGTLEVSEDCLTLNVVRPTGVGSSDRLPVLIWIHGGGFSQGSSSMANYNMSWIIDQSTRLGTPIIGVSINYRLGAFGWLWSEELKRAGASNLGLRDQRMAFQWVQENIAAFGGDPGKGLYKHCLIHRVVHLS